MNGIKKAARFLDSRSTRKRTWAGLSMFNILTIGQDFQRTVESVWRQHVAGMKEQASEVIVKHNYFYREAHWQTENIFDGITKFVFYQVLFQYQVRSHKRTQLF